MDRKYIYIKEGQQNGPLVKEELIGKINPETLIWHEGLGNWKKASEIYELLNIQLIPPPIQDDLVKSDKKIEVLYKFYLISFILLSDFSTFAQPPGGDDNGGVLEGDDDPVAATINGKLILLAIIGLLFVIYTFRKNKKPFSI
jgi:hypothetical protein